ncbi:MAG: hypothetical protein WCQ95_12770 [Bacteroidota bacterium]
MICKKCYAENPTNASICEKCGDHLSTQNEIVIGRSKLSDTIIIVISIFLMFSKLFWLSVSNVRGEMWQVLQYVSSFFNLIWAAIPILLAFVVKNKVWRIILIISGGIYALLSLINIVKDLLHPFIYNNF